MKKLLSLTLLFVLVLCGCNRHASFDPSSQPQSSNGGSSVQSVDAAPVSQPLKSVLEGKCTFINENGDSVYLKDYKFSLVDDLTFDAEKYAVLDFDGNGTDELLVYGSSDFGIYILLRVYEGKVYGYEFGDKSLFNVKQNGTFFQSEGAGINCFVCLVFDSTDYRLNELAYGNDYDCVYRVAGADVSADEYKAFYDNWNKKPAVDWTVIEK